MTTLKSIPPVQPTADSEQATFPESFVGPCGLRYHFTLVKNPEKLVPFQQQWQALAARTADPNPFYEDWFFLPAARHLGQTEDWRILLVHATEARNPGPLELHGFFPFVRSRSYYGLPEWTLWKNPFCYLTSPLIDRKQTTAVLRAVFQFTRTHGENAFLNFPMMSGEGPLHQAMIEILRENLSTFYLPDQYLRATITRPENAEDYLKQSLGGHHMREYRRKRRKLENLGQLEYRQIEDIRGADCWIDWFLDLEANGWKARAGTAIKLHPEQTAFFREMIGNGLQAGKVRLEGLFLNGDPIALKCLLFARPSAFAFKIAFDESYHTSSPGVQLEIQSLNSLAQTPDIETCDSCAIPGHQMIDRLWGERRVMRHLVISSGQSLGEIAIGTLPLLRAVNRVRKRWVESLRRHPVVPS